MVPLILVVKLRFLRPILGHPSWGDPCRIPHASRGDEAGAMGLGFGTMDPCQPQSQVCRQEIKVARISFFLGRKNGRTCMDGLKPGMFHPARLDFWRIVPVIMILSHGHCGYMWNISGSTCKQPIISPC